MIAVECPQCGAATPAFPLTPDRVACRACRYDGPPKPEVVEQLRAAGAQLGGANAHHARQIGQVQAIAHGNLLRHRARLHRLLVVLILPLGALGACTAFASLVDDPNYTVALLCGIPLLTFGLAMVLGSRYLDAQARKLAEACGAIPPATPGAPALCHLCGAALPPTTNESPISRCRHCGADNVASPEVLGEIVKRRHVVIGKFQESLAARTGTMATNTASAVTLVFVFGIASPFIGCIGAFGLQTALDSVELETIPTEYVFASVHGRICASLIDDKLKNGTFVVYQPYGDTVIEDIPDGARYTRVRESWFLKQRVTGGPYEGNAGGIITRVFVHILRPERNQVWVRGEGKGSINFVRTIEGVCLVDPPKSIVAIDWPLRAQPDASADTSANAASSTGASAAPPAPPFGSAAPAPKGR